MSKSPRALTEAKKVALEKLN